MSMSHLPPPLDYLDALDRYNFLKILHAANQSEEHQFVKQACLLWLVNYPGDLFVQYLQGRNYFNLGKNSQALSIYESLLIKDPLFIEPVQALSRYTTSPTKKAYYQQIQQYLTQRSHQSQPAGWLAPLWEARQAFNAGAYEEATRLVHNSLVHNPPSPLPAILHLKGVYKLKNQEMLSNLSEIYYQKWPKCLQVNIVKALSELEDGRTTAAVERLHWAAANDSAGQVIQRLLGADHRFRDLWPQNMEIYFDLAIPASVSAFLGWNQLESGQMVHPELKQKTTASQIPSEAPETSQHEQPAKDTQQGVQEQAPSSPEEKNHREWATEEDFEDIQKAFDRLAKRLKKPDIGRTDTRFPIYTVLSSRKQLETLYGPNTAAIIDNLLKELVNHIRQLPEWGALLFYPDDPSQMSHLGLKPIAATDAWQIKLALTDLDEALANHGEMVGAVLIVGGPDIIPFHHLPNPTNDSDVDVPSDNPYATIDENYFIPQWPVGRLPGETNPDAGHLLAQIRRLIYRYEQKTQKFISGGLTFSGIIQWIMQLFSNLGIRTNKHRSVGYAAEIWQEPSAAVYGTLDRPKNLWLSPPDSATSIDMAESSPFYSGYFNLHGVQDGPNWYGQKDFTSETGGPDYPIALTPTQFSEAVPAPEILLTEACYGANILNKRLQEAMSLKCLDSGTRAFIGSTCIAYGSVTLPLIAADFLAQNFWAQIKEGYAVGYALMRAKLNLAQQMTRLQGFLDGEDQKTLLSFVLYGDPLASFDGCQPMPKPLFRSKVHPMVKTVSDSELGLSPDSGTMPGVVRTKVKRIVEKYLPGLDNAEMSVNSGRPPSIGGAKTKQADTRYIVTLKKTIRPLHDPTHLHIARMTFNQKGQLIKLTSSR